MWKENMWKENTYNVDVIGYDKDMLPREIKIDFNYKGNYFILTRNKKDGKFIIEWYDDTGYVNGLGSVTGKIIDNAIDKWEITKKIFKL